jgi:hypothetical protein
MVKQLKQRALWARTLSEEQRNPDGAAARRGEMEGQDGFP